MWRRWQGQGDYQLQSHAALVIPSHCPSQARPPSNALAVCHCRVRGEGRQGKGKGTTRPTNSESQRGQLVARGSYQSQSQWSREQEHQSAGRQRGLMFCLCTYQFVIFLPLSVQESQEWSREQDDQSAAGAEHGHRKGARGGLHSRLCSTPHMLCGLLRCRAPEVRHAFSTPCLKWGHRTVHYSALQYRVPCPGHGHCNISKVCRVHKSFTPTQSVPCRHCPLSAAGAPAKASRLCSSGKTQGTPAATQQAPLAPEPSSVWPGAARDQQQASQGRRESRRMRCRRGALAWGVW